MSLTQEDREFIRSLIREAVREIVRNIPVALIHQSSDVAVERFDERVEGQQGGSR